MNIYFSGLGGVGIGPLAEIAYDAGYTVTGSDLAENLVTNELQTRGIPISIGQDGSYLREVHSRNAIDWFVHTSALPADHPELTIAKELGIRTAKRDAFLAEFLKTHKLKLVAISGTHGKTTTTGMVVWALKQLGVPVSYSVGSTVSFGPSGSYDPNSEFFIYECDEYDKNLLHFSPFLSLLTSIDYDHPDTYPTDDEYKATFRQYITQSAHTIAWQKDLAYIEQSINDFIWALSNNEVADITLPGEHNRRNATLVVKALEYLHLGSIESNTELLGGFPGTDRRFEKLADNLYSDYGHHPEEIAATLQLAREISDHVVLVYQPHQNWRQHFVRDQYTDQFDAAETIYWLPTYLTRENPDQPILSPQELTDNVTNHGSIHYADLNDDLWNEILKQRDKGALVLCMGAGTIDSWIREQLNRTSIANILVVDTNGNFIAQHRDNKPTISNPDMLTAFGGHVEPFDTNVRAAATRELHEETNLIFEPSDLKYFKTYRKTLDTYNEDSFITFFVLKNAQIRNLEVYEGQGFDIIRPDSNLDEYNTSKLFSIVIKDYLKHD